MMRIKNFTAFFLISFIVVGCARKIQGPQTYEELGKQIVENLRIGDYENMKLLWPTESGFKTLTKTCFASQVELNDAGVNDKAKDFNNYREHIRDMIEKQIPGMLPDLKDAQYLSTTFKDANDCPAMFITNGEMQVLMAVKSDTVRIKGTYVAHTKSGDFYFLDKININKISNIH